MLDGDMETLKALEPYGPMMFSGLDTHPGVRKYKLGTFEKGVSIGFVYYGNSKIHFFVLPDGSGTSSAEGLRL